MAIPWLVVLQSIPWTDVIRNAPKVTEGAKKLWNAVSMRSPTQELPAEHADLSTSPDAESIAILQARVAALETAATDLHNQMLASSELIKTLADQNAQFIKRIEVNRVRVIWLTGATAVFGIIAVLSLTLVLVR